MKKKEKKGVKIVKKKVIVLFLSLVSATVISACTATETPKDGQVDMEDYQKTLEETKEPVDTEDTGREQKNVESADAPASPAAEKDTESSANDKDDESAEASASPAAEKDTESSANDKDDESAETSASPTAEKNTESSADNNENVSDISTDISSSIDGELLTVENLDKLAQVLGLKLNYEYEGFIVEGYSVGVGTDGSYVSLVDADSMCLLTFNGPGVSTWYEYQYGVYTIDSAATDMRGKIADADRIINDARMQMP